MSYKQVTKTEEVSREECVCDGCGKESFPKGLNPPEGWTMLVAHGPRTKIEPLHLGPGCAKSFCEGLKAGVSLEKAMAINGA